jgi:shikimate dehydrogenase
MAPAISKDTQLCISLAGRPSNLGTRFHNFLYDELGLDFVYKACTTTDLAGAIAGIRALGIRGCGVSMPFKEDCIPLLDALDPSARAIDSVNTIVNDLGALRGFNTDYSAVRTLVAEAQSEPSGPFVLVGSGGMAKAVVAALRDLGHHAGTIVARNEVHGRKLAARYGYEWRAHVGDLRPSLLVNATPIGMDGVAGQHELPVSSLVVDAAAVVVDVVATPSETPLVRRARSNRATVVTGAEVAAVQAAEQFLLYTGVRPTDDQVRRASAHSRAT